MAKRRKLKEKAPSSALTTTPRKPVDLIPYLGDDDVEKTPVILALVPPDLLRCQCEWPDTTMETFGPKPIIRCDHPPSVVAFQKRHRADHEPTGMMALCNDHRVLVEHMYPNACYYREITHNGQIGEVV
jgi:hypothetical protein